MFDYLGFGTAPQEPAAPLNVIDRIGTLIAPLISQPQEPAAPRKVIDRPTLTGWFDPNKNLPLTPVEAPFIELINFSKLSQAGKQKVLSDPGKRKRLKELARIYTDGGSDNIEEAAEAIRQDPEYAEYYTQPKPQPKPNVSNNSLNTGNSVKTNSQDKAHQERVARIKKARETGIFDNQHIKDLQDEEAYQRGGGTGKTVAQVAVQQAAGAGGGGAKTTSAASPASEKSAAKNPEPEAKPSYSRTEEAAYIAYLSKAAQETQDPEVRAALERMAAEKTKNLEMQNIREQYGSAGVAAFLAAQNPYNAMTNPTGWQGLAPGAGVVAPGAAADVAGRLSLQRMSQAAAEVARLRQVYGQGAGAHEFLRPGSASYNSFGALSPEQQLAAIQAANTYSGAFNQNTKNSAGNMTELYRKAGFKPSEVPQVDPARFAPGYKWQPPTAPVAPVMPTYVTPGFADPQAPVQYPANPMAGTPMPYAMAPINPFSLYQA